jgi:hypothetical protein
MMMADIKAGRMVVAALDWSCILYDGEGLESYSDAALLRHFRFVDVECNQGPPEAKLREPCQYWEFRQSHRVLQQWCKDMQAVEVLARYIQAYTSNSPAAASMTLASVRKARRDRFLVLNRILIQYSTDDGIVIQPDVFRVERPNPACIPCVNNDPRYDIYCHKCYEKIGVKIL